MHLMNQFAQPNQQMDSFIFSNSDSYLRDAHVNYGIHLLNNHTNWIMHLIDFAI